MVYSSGPCTGVALVVHCVPPICDMRLKYFATSTGLASSLDASWFEEAVELGNSESKRRSKDG